MKNNRYFLIYFLLLLFTILKVRAQDTNSYNLVSNLPPLQVLIDSALIKSPYLKYQNAEIIKQQFKLRIAKQDWSKNIGFSGDVIYGTWDHMTMNPNAGTTSISTQAETRYGAGLYLRLPLSDALTRKSTVEIARLELEEAKAIKEQKVVEIRNLVISQYNQVVLNQSLLIILNKNRQSCEVQLKLIEKQFLNGQATVEELSRVTDIYYNSLVEYERVKSDLNTAYLLLQELVGMAFPLIK